MIFYRDYYMEKSDIEFVSTLIVAIGGLIAIIVALGKLILLYHNRIRVRIRILKECDRTLTGSNQQGIIFEATNLSSKPTFINREITMSGYNIVRDKSTHNFLIDDSYSRCLVDSVPVTFFATPTLLIRNYGLMWYKKYTFQIGKGLFKKNKLYIQCANLRHISACHCILGVFFLKYFGIIFPPAKK